EAARTAQAFFTVSASTRAAIVEHLGVPAERVHLVPNAADHFTPLPRAHPNGTRPGDPATNAARPADAGESSARPARTTEAARGALLCVGHLEPRKNLALVLHALAHDRELPRAVFAGAAKGDHAEELDRLARTLGVRERVTFLGPFGEGELARLYAECAAVVLPSRVEGFGIAALEAQRARAPLAIARIPALVEVAGASTPSFDPGDAAECARAIRAALSRDAKALELDARHAARFTWDASAHAWCDALCAVHASNRLP
ncbi:MAG: glycosyltransferase, partial [Planctomycetes bacterium]|nr:glycosyltransferase [Planctomycetota bacterium]